jgi:hypothetical protein
VRALQLTGWAVAAVVVAAWLALVEVFWLPLRVGGVPVPVSLVAAVFGNVVLADTARRLSGSRLVGVLPAVVWLGIALAAGSRRPEGDLLIVGGDAVTQLLNLGFLLVGVIAAAFAVGRVLGGPPVSRAGAGTSSGAAR